MALDGLAIGQRLGGSRAQVHRAVDTRSGATVVVKLGRWEHPAVTAALAREASILGRVRHRSLVRLLDVREDVEGRSLVLAHAADGDLDRRLRARGPMDPADAADLGARLAGALAALHAAGVVHRDIRPCNVVIDTELVPLLCDLDHALDPDSPPLPTDAMVVGDPAHLDPRVLEGVPADRRADLFALGSTVWAAATGGAGRPVDLRRARHTVPEPLAASIDACLGGRIDGAVDAAVLFERVAALLRERRPARLPPDRPPRGAPPRTAPQVPSATAVPPPPTRRWGAPAREAVGPAHAARVRPDHRRRRAAVVAGTAVLALTGAALAGWVAIGRHAADTAAARAPDGSSQPDATAVIATAPTWSTPVAVSPPPCPGEVVTHRVAAGEQRVLADIDGVGCSRVLTYEDGVLTTSLGAFEVGADGDVLLAGDWDGDGRWTPALHRPTTGAVFLFDQPLEPDRPFTSRPAMQVPIGAAAIVVDEAGGTHRVVAGRSP